MTSIIIHSQPFNRGFKNQYGNISFLCGKFIITQYSDDNSYISGNQLEAIYYCSNDTIIVNQNNNKYLFLIKSDGIITSLSNIYNYVKKGETLFANKYYYTNGKIMMIGWGWKNGGKDGKWLFFDENGVESGIVFKEGKIVATFDVNVVHTNEE